MLQLVFAIFNFSKFIVCHLIFNALSSFYRYHERFWILKFFALSNCHVIVIIIERFLIVCINRWKIFTFVQIYFIFFGLFKNKNWFIRFFFFLIISKAGFLLHVILIDFFSVTALLLKYWELLSVMVICLNMRVLKWQWMERRRWWFYREIVV